MVEIGWLQGAPRTNSGRKWMTDRTKNYNLILSNCLPLAKQMGTLNVGVR
jgi:hypothetical protein